MIIVILMKVAIATTVMTEFVIVQRQRFLTKSKRIMFDIETKRHTPSIQPSVPSSDHEQPCESVLHSLCMKSS
jgi:hypothetical protein